MDSVCVAPKSDFAIVLRQRLAKFFQERHLSPKGDSLMRAKIILGLLSFSGAYSALYVLPFNLEMFVLVYIFFGLAQLFLLLNIAHDANHYATSRRRSVNQALTYIFDLCGINSYMWRILHNQGHHPNINLRGHDEDIIARGYLRLTPDTPRKWIHRYQHIYAWFLYGFSTLDYVLVKDIEYFFFTKCTLLDGVKHRPREYMALLAGKIFYFGYMVVLPVVVLRYPPLVVLGAFSSMHFVIGVLSQLVFQGAHAIDTNRFPTKKSEFEDYTCHILATTVDYATQSTLAKWLLGGLNHHVVHHICPSVCHTHYGHLTKIVKDTAQQYQMPYRENATIWNALVQHFLLLKRLGLES